jgi:serine/threonine-protein kinase
MSTAAVSTGASGLASADEGTKVEVPQPPPPKGKGALVAFAAVAALLALTGVALGFRAFELRRTAAARAVAPPGDPPPPVIALPGPTSAKAAPADGSAGLPVATSPPVEASVSVATAKSATPKKPPVPWSRPVHAPPPPARRDPAASAASAEGGFLTLDTYPWTQVTLGGRALGTTPLVHLPLPAGTHTLTLDNAAENVHRVTVVVVKPGEVTSRRLAF